MVDLTFTSTVSRELVHRAAVCEVFITDSAPADASGNHYLLAGQLPRAHSFYSDGTLTPKSYDPMLVMESARQGGMLLVHRYLGAAPGDMFVLNSCRITISDPAALKVGSAPGRQVMTASVTDSKLRRGSVVGMALEMAISLDGRHAGHADFRFQWMPDSAWRAVRRRGRSELPGIPVQPIAPATRVDPRTVGRRSSDNVVLTGLRRAGDGRHVSGVVVDQAHPALFDHPLDHIPGMLVLEAMRQTAIAATCDVFGHPASRLIPVGFAAEFTRFGEFELPTECLVNVLPRATGPGGVAEVEIVQAEHVIARGSVELAVLDAAAISAEPWEKELIHG